MKLLQKLPIIALVMALLSSCSLSKMIELAKKQELDVKPAPLELHGDSVKFDITGKLPIEMLKKGTKYTMKTSYNYGDQKYEFQDIDIDSDEYIGKTEGAAISESFSFPYSDDMSSGVLKLTGVASKKGSDKIKSTPELDIATGIITTSRMVRDLYKVSYTDAGFDTKEELIPLNVDFFFGKNKSVLRTSEIKGENGKVLDQFIASKIITKKVTITGSHSPEGPEAINEDLSQNRAKAIENFYFDRMKRYDYKNLADSIQFETKTSYRDWTSLKDVLVYEAYLSNDQEEGILNVIEGSGTFEEKELQLQKLPYYKTLYNEIYPTLRTSKTEILKLKEKKSEAEITLVSKDIIEGRAEASALEVNEILYAATLTPILKEKEALYKAATKADDNWKAHTNLSSTYLEMANAAIKENDKVALLNLSETHANLALKQAGANPTIQNNLGIISMLKGNKTKAISEFEKGKKSASGDELNAIKVGLASTQIASGDYSSALANLNGIDNTVVNGVDFNNALANTLNKNYSVAETTLKKHIDSNPKDGDAYYLLSIINARNNSPVELRENLNKAIDINAKYSDLSLKNLEFKEYIGNETSK